MNNLEEDAEDLLNILCFNWTKAHLHQEFSLGIWVSANFKGDIYYSTSIPGVVLLIEKTKNKIYSIEIQVYSDYYKSLNIFFDEMMKYSDFVFKMNLFFKYCILWNPAAYSSIIF